MLERPGGIGTSQRRAHRSPQTETEGKASRDPQSRAGRLERTREMKSGRGDMADTGTGRSL